MHRLQVKSFKPIGGAPNTTQKTKRLSFKRVHSLLSRPKGCPYRKTNSVDSICWRTAFDLRTLRTFHWDPIRLARVCCSEQAQTKQRKSCKIVGKITDPLWFELGWLIVYRFAATSIRIDCSDAIRLAPAEEPCFGELQADSKLKCFFKWTEGNSCPPEASSTQKQVLSSSSFHNLPFWIKLGLPRIRTTDCN